MIDGTLAIVTGGDRRVLRAWIARSNADLMRGLIGRRGIADDHAMVLDFGSTVVANITMQGMVFPIDAVFVGEDGHPTMFARMRPGEPNLAADARWVIELSAGSVDRLGIDLRTIFLARAV